MGAALVESELMQLVCVTIDCADPRSLASFWAAALGCEHVHVAADNSGATVRPRGTGVYLELIRVPEAKAGKNRVHMGFTAGPLEDLDREIQRLEALGATLAWEESFPPEVAARYRNVVLRDPEGNELCLSGGDWH